MAATVELSLPPEMPMTAVLPPAAGHLLAHPLQHPGKLELYVESAHVIPPVNG